MLHIDRNKLREAIVEFRHKTSVLESIINPILEKYPLEEKEKLEVCQIGGFLQIINPEIVIIDKPKPPNPDFILKLGDRIIGLEHSRIINDEKSQKYFSLKNLIDDAEIEFRKRFPKLKIGVNIRVKNDELKYKKSEKEALIDTICNNVLKVNSGNLNLPLSFISSIEIMPHSKISFSYIEDDFRSDKLPKEKLSESIHIKEKKLKKYYSNNTSLNEFWLVLIIGSLSSASYEIDETLNYSTSSDFHKVFLVSEFKGKSLELTNTVLA